MPALGRERGGDGMDVRAMDVDILGGARAIFVQCARAAGRSMCMASCGDRVGGMFRLCASMHEVGLGAEETAGEPAWCWSLDRTGRRTLCSPEARARSRENEARRFPNRALRPIHDVS